MPTDKPPYVMAYGNIGKALKKIKAAQTPPRFTVDFLATKLGLRGGSSRPLIPFFKRTGFLGGDGVPTERYKRFRNPGQTGRSAFEALKEGYRSLYEVNEYIHDASDNDLLGTIVQVTGLEPSSSTTKAIVGSFKALKDFAIADEDEETEETEAQEDDPSGDEEKGRGERGTLEKGLGLSYTINLNLPPTSDIKVFDAIFKSLREHLLR